MAGGIGQPVEQRGPFLAVLGAAQGGVEAAHSLHAVQGTDLPQPRRLTAQQPAQFPLRRFRPPLTAELLLDPSLPLPQLPQAAGDPHQRAAVPQLMTQGAPHERHHVTAETHPPPRVEALHRADQRLAAHLHQILLGQSGAGAEPAGDAAGDRQVGGDEGVAPATALLRRGGGGIGRQPLPVASSPTNRI